MSEQSGSQEKVENDKIPERTQQPGNAQPGNKEKTENSGIYILIFAILIPLCGFIMGLWKFKCEILGCPDCESESIVFNSPNYRISELRNLNKAYANEFDFSSIVDSAEAFNKLSKYYQKQNEFYKISTTKHYLNFIIGHAGSGKSFVFREISSLLPNAKFNVKKVSLNKLCKCRDTNCTGWVSQKQLETTSSEYTNTFSSLPLNSKLSIQHLLKENQITHDKLKQNILFIDDCDEVHPLTITSLIQSITDFNNSSDKPKWKFFLIGRAEAFRDYFTQTHREPATNYERYYLKSPQYRTLGDINFRILDCKEFENKDIDPLLVSKRIIGSPDSLKAFAKRQLSDLQCGNYIIAELNKSNIRSIDSLQTLLYLSYLKRSEQTHCRPSEKDRLYKGLLKQVALDYANKVDGDGFFLVKSDDEVKVEFCDNKVSKSVSVKVQDLLEFSGIVDVRPLSDNHSNYKFTPFWIHRFLIRN